MTRKAMSIIGRIIGLLLVVALAFGITWCATHWSKVQAESQKVWDKLFGKKDQQEQVQPTPSEEQFSLDGLYYTFDFDGYIRFFRFKDNQFGNIERGGARGPDDKTITEIYLPSDWETQELTESYHTTEDEEYIRAYCKNPDGQDFVFAIYDKATKKLYYDFSNGEQLPGKTYEEQMLIEMVKFDKFVIHDHVHGRRSVFKEPTCTESGVVFIYCEDCRDMCDIEYPSSLGHDYVGGKCTRCGESDPNYVEEVSLIDGLYYRARTDGTIDVFQIEGAKYANFVGYTQNGDESKIYLTQGWETYIEQYGLSITIDENDTQIICGVPELMEQYKDYPELYEAYSNYFVYDKQTKELRFGMNKVVLTRIDVYNILPYEEPRIYVENDVLHMTDMTGTDGTYTVYYRFNDGSYEGQYPDSYFEEQAYVVGNVTELDLSLLINRESVPMLKGCTYEIRVVFATTDGFLIQGYESIQYTAPNAEHTHSYEWQTKIDATCISAGAEQGFCSCGASADREIPALGHDYVDGVCSRCGETALTWQLNDRLTLFGKETKVFDINFISNNQSFKAICFTLSADPIMYYLTDAADMGSGITLYSENFKWMGHDETDHSAYRTISFETAPTGDLLAWLQANATPQV